MLGSAAQILVDALRSAHGVAFLFGAVVYLAYSAFLTVGMPSFLSFAAPPVAPRRRKSDGTTDGEEGAPSEAHNATCSKGSRLVVRLGAAGVIVAALCLFAILAPEAAPESCPADIDDAGDVDEAGSQELPLAVPPAGLSAAAAARRGSGTISKGFKLSAALADARARSEAELANNPVPSDPQSHLARAHKAEAGILMAGASGTTMDSDTLRMGALAACVTWEAEDVPSVAQLFAQLECQGELVEAGKATRSDSAALVAAGRETVRLLRAAGAADTPELSDTWGAAQVEWARITQGALESQSIGLYDDVRTLRRSKGPIKKVIASLRGLRKIMEPFQESLVAVQQGDAHLAAIAAAGGVDAGDELAELRETQGSLLASMLQLLQESRVLAQALPLSDEALRSAIRCDPSPLADLEALILTTAAESKHAGAIFALGGYWSELAVSEERSAPFFPSLSDPAWVPGSGGSRIPEDMALAEDFLLRGEEATLGSLESDRGASRALRLYRHAKLLALKHHDAAAEWRYRESAQVAASFNRQKLAAHSLTRLGYFLLLRSRHQEASEAIDDALTHFQDPLAQYLQVRLARGAGKLATEDQLRAAEQQLLGAAGKMPSEALEEERERDHANFRWWRIVTEGGLRNCVDAGDAAQFFICLFSGIVFGLPV